jgi:predicted ATP-binding protein involved in virulence
MRLKTVTLKNFRCFESLQLDLHPRLTVLVGKNGGGKTAILDAIAVGLTPVLHYLSSANQRLAGTGIKDTDFSIEAWDSRAGKERWGASDYAQVTVETTSGLKWDTWRPSSAGKEPEAKIGQSELAKAMAAVSDSFKTETPELLPVFAYYGAQRGYIEIPERLRPSKQNYGHPTSALYDALDSHSDFREMLMWFDLEESSELRANKGNRGEDFEESVALASVRTAINQVLGGDFSNPRFNKIHKFIVDAAEGPSPLQVLQLSQGYKSMLALAMDFARRMAIANSHLDAIIDLETGQTLEPFNSIISELEEIDPDWVTNDLMQGIISGFDVPTLVAPGIMLIDEIDLHLHPEWQQRVLSDLMRAFPTTQFIVTTHSPQVLSTAPSECIRILADREVFAAPPGTEGAEPERLLKQVLGLKEVRPPNKATQDLKEYIALVEDDQWASPRALELRKLLDDRYQGNEPGLLEADLLIENRKWELGE